MIKLTGPDGSELELSINGYQFPDMKDNGWDSEWLYVSGAVSSPKGKWKFHTCCLTTFELESLRDWMKNLSSDGSKPEIDFTEPNLRFTNVDADTLGVAFSQESSPPWANEKERYGNGVVVNFSKTNIPACIAGLNTMILKYPVRSHDR